MYAYASVLFALYSLGDILVCFLKYRPKKTGRENGICRQSLSVLAVAGLVLTSCGIYTKYQRPEDITTDGLYEHDLDGQSLDSLSLFAASDTVSIASLSWLELFTDTQL
jgi:hypothetical protein